jgi:tellurite resistance protein
MYSQELEKLISIAVMDGEITTQEKQVLLKKAISLGVDPDEFEIVLAARLFSFY